MGCAMQEQQTQQQPEQQQPTLKAIVNKDVQETTDYHTMCSQTHQQPPTGAVTANVNHSNSNTINNLNKFSQLKESHSALVKILESAPLQQQQQPSQPAAQQPPSTQTASRSVVTSEQIKTQLNSIVTIDELSASPLAINDTINGVIRETQSAAIGGGDGHHPTNYHHHHQHQYHIHHHHHHRKRNKQHVVDEHCDSLDKSSEEDDELGGSSSSTSSASSVTSEVETIFPWKKTRIAREWRQHKMQATTNAVTIATVADKKLTAIDGGSIVDHNNTTANNTNNNHSNSIVNEHEMHVDDDGDCDDDDEDETDNHNCECHYHHHRQHNCRRISSDSSDSLQNDSGCDSDCPENISELCKKFDENFIKQDVNILLIIPSLNLCMYFSHVLIINPTNIIGSKRMNIYSLL